MNYENLINNALGFALLEKKSLDYQIQSIQTISISAQYFYRSSYSDIYDFFNEINNDYDSDLRNPYWAFSHEILKYILKKFIDEHFCNFEKIKLFDAGAGTGNWSKFILDSNRHIDGILFDMNKNMLDIAYLKNKKSKGNSIKFIEGNLETFDNFPSERGNLILCMHNVIGLGRNTDLILKNLYLYLEQNGIAFIMVPNKYHAFNFTRKYGNNFETIRVINDKTVKFKPDMPEMFCYTPQEFEIKLINAGFREVTVLGFPVTIYPSIKDTKLMQKDTLEQQLKNAESRVRLLDLEKRLCLYPELAYRGGSSLIAICKKHY